MQAMQRSWVLRRRLVAALRPRFESSAAVKEEAPKAPGQWTEEKHAPAVEHVSAAKGIVLNRIAKEMVVYPEIELLEDLERIQSFKAELDAFMEEHCDSAAIDASGEIPPALWDGLKERGAFALTIDKKYGGLGLSRKEYCLVTEALSRDWSVFASLAVHNDLVVQAIQRYGTEAQRMEYLPRLANGEITGAWCVAEEGCGYDISRMTTYAEKNPSGPPGSRLLRGRKDWVTGGAEAELLVVLASINPAPRLGQESKYNPLTTAFIVERTKAGATLKNVGRRSTVGLRGTALWDLEFDGAATSSVLGGEGSGWELATAVEAGARYSFGAAVSAWMRRLIGEIAERSNSVRRFERDLSENATVQRRVHDLASATFALESLTFFVAGMQEEEGADRDFRLDSDICHRLAKRVLSMGVVTAMEVLGSASLAQGGDVVRLFRDAATLTSFLGNPDVLTESITLQALTAWAAEHAEDIAKLRRPDYNPFFIINERWARLKARHAPTKLHYLNERLHPSLEDSARMFETTLSRFEVVFSEMIENHGRNIDRESFLMERIADILTDLSAMLALLGRTSRSYSIGLRHTDEELVWAHSFTNEARRRVTGHLDEMLSFQHMMRDDILKKAVATHVFEKNGYPISHPLDRNW